MSCLKCDHCAWDGIQNICEIHDDYDILSNCYRACKQYCRIYGVDDPEDDTPEGMIVEIGKSWGDDLPDDSDIEIYYYED